MSETPASLHQETSGFEKAEMGKKLQALYEISKIYKLNCEELHYEGQLGFEERTKKKLYLEKEPKKTLKWHQIRKILMKNIEVA